ncbi:E3 UFM1-protein ligase 1-like protein [Auxenochlorella protothecoides]|uniref:E3 UFM1-protein ligase 1-like protein n=1 Tax=Auxenochlorella protothecoides TaxID=3075 RepID=A0A087SN94_AUXPR|nr:E3 UFM1-protein ligase 1-like protein [Auxenochlorella protothecoides]KFM27198.1 E3 UFM1-protein ligase 1-like protein [Auxenochlorella protothecoides]
MEEPSLLDLLQGLEDVQTKKTEVRLSERNVVELVNKLKGMGLIGDDLLHTSNGREYITRDALTRKVLSTARASRRVPLVDLPAALGVDLLHCQEAARQAAAGAGAHDILLAQDELFAREYFDDLAAEVDEVLEEQGMAPVGDLAQRFGLASDLLLIQLRPHLGRDVRARLEGGYLYTQALTVRLKAQLRGALRGSTVPIGVPALLSSLDLGGTPFLQSLVPGLVEQLVAEGAVHGSLAGGATTWIPAAFVATQVQQARQSFAENGFLDWSTAKRFTTQDPKNWAARELGGGVALEHSYASHQLLHQLEAAMEETLAEGSWLDARPLLPPALPEEDAEELVLRSTSKFPSLSELGREEGLRLRAADKRREKELLAGHSAELEARLAACEPGDGPAVLAVAVPLLLATHASKLVNLPGRALAPALRALEGKLMSEAAELLPALHAAVLTRLQGGEGGAEMEELARRTRLLLLGKMEGMTA